MESAVWSTNSTYFFWGGRMLCSQNCGKYLYKKFADDRAKAVENKENFTDDELTYLEITGTEGTAVHQDRTYLIATQPIDPETPQEYEKIDIRLIPKNGGVK